MKKSSFLENKTALSPMNDSMVLANSGSSGKKEKKELGLALPLTSLIDAFSIIVIYLLIGTQGGGIEADTKGLMTLPTADSAMTIEVETPTLRIEKGRYFINDEQVSERNLIAKLSEVKKASGGKETALMIQADTKMKYSDLDPLIKAGSLAGIEKLKFAVVPTK